MKSIFHALSRTMSSFLKDLSRTCGEYFSRPLQDEEYFSCPLQDNEFISEGPLQDLCFLQLVFTREGEVVNVKNTKLHSGIQLQQLAELGLDVGQGPNQTTTKATMRSEQKGKTICVNNIFVSKPHKETYEQGNNIEKKLKNNGQEQRVVTTYLLRNKTTMKNKFQTRQWNKRSNNGCANANADLENEINSFVEKEHGMKMNTPKEPNSIRKITQNRGTGARHQVLSTGPGAERPNPCEAGVERPNPCQTRFLASSPSDIHYVSQKVQESNALGIELFKGQNSTFHKLNSNIPPNKGMRARGFFNFLLKKDRMYNMNKILLLGFSRIIRELHNQPP
ncbi:hypothetical protein Fmac_011601 [Flemingia macrophylla]|uniref:Uncharacterized protein n=1 Tax=Flemingia macrophylla TaxID=520843 RepID=A0ABD1MMY1_9FABA